MSSRSPEGRNDVRDVGELVSKGPGCLQRRSSDLGELVSKCPLCWQRRSAMLAASVTSESPIRSESVVRNRWHQSSLGSPRPRARVGTTWERNERASESEERSERFRGAAWQPGVRDFFASEGHYANMIRLPPHRHEKLAHFRSTPRRCWVGDFNDKRKVAGH